MQKRPDPEYYYNENQSPHKRGMPSNDQGYGGGQGISNRDINYDREERRVNRDIQQPNRNNYMDDRRGGQERQENQYPQPKRRPSGSGGSGRNVVNNKLKNENVVTAILTLIKDLGETELELIKDQVIKKLNRFYDGEANDTDDYY